MSLSKRTRFEVFKRDSFTCQYCGKKAPDVILHVDHVVPRAKGGGDEMLNLVTACDACNGGKSDIALSDDSAISKQRAQMESLQERQEQITMMIEWQKSLLDLDAQTVSKLEEFWCEMANWAALTETGRQTLRKLVRRFSVEEVMQAMRAAATGYFKFDAEQQVTEESADLAFRKLGGICAIRRAEIDKPYLADLFYIRGILRNRLEGHYYSPHEAKELLEIAFSWDADAEELKTIARGANSWTAWKNEMYDYISALKSEPPYTPGLDP